MLTGNDIYMYVFFFSLIITMMLMGRKIMIGLRVEIFALSLIVSHGSIVLRD
jgi:hypothetical protein